MKKNNKLIIIVLVLAVLGATAFFILNKRGETDVSVDDSIPRLTVTSSAFENLGSMPDKYRVTTETKWKQKEEEVQQKTHSKQASKGEIKKTISIEKKN